MRRNDKGFSLVEIAIAIAVVTIIILSIIGSAGMRETARIQSASNSIHTIYSAAENYLASGHLDYTGMDVETLKSAKLLPDSIGNNSFGGLYVVAPVSSDPTHFKVDLTGLTQVQATKLSAIFQNNAQSSSFDAGTWSVIF